MFVGQISGSGDAGTGGREKRGSWILTDDKISSLAFILYREGGTVWFLGR